MAEPGGQIVTGTLASNRFETGFGFGFIFIVVSVRPMPP